LSLFVQKKCTVSEKIFVPKKSFSPAPKVDSSVIFFQLHNKFNDIDDNDFLALIKASFSNPRKKMISNLSNF
jgi:16S rRNA A1518/A1519 N6-dimethyltransferase RsmA/KsgA/DIM1 with predicted DNA glycosylase/AP lyase activity